MLGEISFREPFTDEAAHAHWTPFELVLSFSQGMTWQEVRSRCINTYTQWLSYSLYCVDPFEGDSRTPHERLAGYQEELLLALMRADLLSLARLFQLMRDCEETSIRAATSAFMRARIVDLLNYRECLIRANLPVHTNQPGIH